MIGLGDNLPWTRFWLPRNEAPPRDPRGYLVDPEGPYGAHLNPHARTLEQLDDTPCVALLGEPGSGKSSVISAYRDARRARDPGRPAATEAPQIGRLRGQGLLALPQARSGVERRHSEPTRH